MFTMKGTTRYIHTRQNNVLWRDKFWPRFRQTLAKYLWNIQARFVSPISQAKFPDLASDGTFYLYEANQLIRLIAEI